MEDQHEIYDRSGGGYWFMLCPTLAIENESFIMGDEVCAPYQEGTSLCIKLPKGFTCKEEISK